ncbi:Ubiquitin fusion degradation protein 4 [Mucor circinelloides]
MPNNKNVNTTTDADKHISYTVALQHEKTTGTYQHMRNLWSSSHPVSFELNKKAAAVVNRLFDIAKPKVPKEDSTWYSKLLLLKDLSLAISKRIIGIEYQD